MKNTLRKRSLFFLINVLALLISNISFGQNQQANETIVNQKQVVKVSGGAANLSSQDNLTEFARYKDGILTSVNGDVQVLVKKSDGTEFIKVFKKPSVNLKATDKNAEMNTYINDMKAWISHNPDFKNYLNAGQLNALGTGNLKALYLYDFEQQMKKNQSAN